MYLKNMNNEVKELVLKINELERENKLKFICYIFNLWDRNQINSLNEVNPNLLDDSIDVEIFNPSNIGYSYLIKEIKEYYNYFESFDVIYTRFYLRSKHTQELIDKLLYSKDAFFKTTDAYQLFLSCKRDSFSLKIAFLISFSSYFRFFFLSSSSDFINLESLSNKDSISLSFSNN